MRYTLCILAAVSLGAGAITDEEYEKIFSKGQAVAVSCMEKEGASGDDLDELITHKVPPSSYATKCIMACLYEHYHMMKEDHSFDKQSSISAFNKLKELDGEAYGKVLKLIDNCWEKQQILEDRCETASLMSVCVMNEAKALGILREILLVSE